MAVVKPSCLRELKLRVGIAEVVGRVATLRKAGSRFKALCPFHNEKSPSFHVDPDKGFYKCFGCGKAGDIISFVRETEQLTFTEAIEALGRRFGVAVEYEEGSGAPTQAERSLRQELFDLHDTAAEYYHQLFLSTASASSTGAWMRTYWTERRRFALALAEEFKIGAADPNDTGLAAALLRKRYSENALRQCGLVYLRDGTLPSLHSLKPRFKGRLMIPIRDHQGRVVAFTARQTDLTPKDDPSHEAKYVNSPETPIFIKGNLLFNLDRARTAVGEGHPFVMVEGQLDALRCWSVGLKTAIAPQGTALTESQLILLRRYHTTLECFFDGDSAGQKAALRVLPLALKTGLEVRFLGGATESKIDPDLLFMARGLDAYAELRSQSLSAMAFACRAHLPRPEAASPEEKTRAANELYTLVAQAESEVARSQFLAEVAQHLRLPLAALQQDFTAQQQRRARYAAEPAAGPGPGAAPGGFASGAPGSGMPLQGSASPGVPSRGTVGTPHRAAGTVGKASASVAATTATHDASSDEPPPSHADDYADAHVGSSVAGSSHQDASAGGGALGAARGSALSLARDTPEYDLLLLVLHFPRYGAALSQTLPPEWIDGQQVAGVLLNRILAEFEHSTWSGREQLDALLETPAEQNMVAALLFEPLELDEPAKVINEGLARLQDRVLAPRQRQIELALANPPTDSHVDPFSLIKELLDIKRRLRTPLRLPEGQ